jgi:hypothetical protein
LRRGFDATAVALHQTRCTRALDLVAELAVRGLSKTRGEGAGSETALWLSVAAGRCFRGRIDGGEGKPERVDIAGAARYAHSSETENAR